MGNEDIKRLRTRLGWTQQHLANELGVSRNAVAQWEMGVRNPRPIALKFLQRLARELDEKRGLTPDAGDPNDRPPPGGER